MAWRVSNRRNLLDILFALITFASVAFGDGPKPVYGHTTIHVNNRLYLYGSDSSLAVDMNQFWFLDTTQPWSTVNPPWRLLTDSTTPYNGNVVAVPTSDEKGFVVIGTNLNVTTGHPPAKWANVYINGQWQTLSNKGVTTPERDHLSATRDPSTGLIYVYGGSGKTNSSREMNILDMKKTTWKTFSPGLDVWPEDLYSYHVVWVKTLNVLMIPDYLPSSGSATNTGFQIVWLYNPDKNFWTPQATKGPFPAARYAPSVVITDDDRVVLYGGVDPVGGSTVFNDIWILDPTTWQWSKPPIKNSPSKGHWAHASSMVGNLMVVMFGQTSPYVTNTDPNIYILDTKTFAWTTQFTPPSLPLTTTSSSTSPTDINHTEQPVNTPKSPGGPPINIIVGSLAAIVTITTVLAIAIFSSKRRRNRGLGKVRAPQQPLSTAHAPHAVLRRNPQHNGEL